MKFIEGMGCVGWLRWWHPKAILDKGNCKIKVK